MKRLSTTQIVDAGTLEGQTADDLTSDGFSIYHDAPVDITGVSSVETALELTGLPAGSYLIIAKTYLTNNGAGDQNLIRESSRHPLRSRRRATVPGFNDVPMTLTVVRTFPSDNGAARIEVRRLPNTNITANWIKITAIGLNGLVNTPG